LAEKMAEAAPKRLLGFGLLEIKKKSLRLLLSQQIFKSLLLWYLESRTTFHVTNGNGIR
jgi:hypothetical protein